MDKRAKEEERLRLHEQIKEWNANRLDLFELSLPNEQLEFHGVMRFFFQDDGAKVATKCIRVSSSATTRDVLDTLIEKFRPDMRMLSLPKYMLYEVHVNGEERKLANEEKPLLVQLNWGKDDREGRFLLKSENEATVPIHQASSPEIQQEKEKEKEKEVSFIRKLSKREKKDKKKKDKEARAKGKENESPNKESSVAEKLYNELPETSFTRSISNPEAVMRRRRQQKLEKKLQQIRSADGGPDQGGTLKIYGESLVHDVPYKTLLLSTADTAYYVVKETLDKYGLDKENPEDYCLVKVYGPPPDSQEYHGSLDREGMREEILDDDECPLAILMQHPPSRGAITYHLKKKPDGYKHIVKRQRKGKRQEDEFYAEQMRQERLPYLVPLNADGTDLPKPKKYRLQLNVTEVGSERSNSTSGQYLQLFGPTIQPRHCVIAHTEGVVTVTPTSREAECYVGGQRIAETTMLTNGVTVRFGRHHAFRFCDPKEEERQMMKRQMHSEPALRHQGNRNRDDPANNFETTFDVDGHIETVSSPSKDGMPRMPPGMEPGMPDILPATLEFREEGEDAFLSALISEVNGANVQFKLSPTYSLYMATRYRISRGYRPDMSPNERAHRLTVWCGKVATITQIAIQDNGDNASALAFWMANASELLHFFKHDREIGPFTLEAQDILAEAVQLAFKQLTLCLQGDLRHVMPAFLHDRDDDEEEDNVFTDNADVDERGQSRQSRGLGAVLQTLSSAMSLLRRCRVNAALTIQLFSQLFHYINMWLFNQVVTEPHLQLCSRTWGLRFKRRLARVEAWAEKQGLELAADCHLCRIIQAAHLLQAPKSSPDDIASISSACFKLNSLQLRALLQHYIPSQGEPRIPQDLIDSVVAVAENTADELTRSDGRDVRLEEDPDLNLPFLLPEDGYSCDVIRGVPGGLPEFVDPLCQTGLCRLTLQPMSSGLWTIYMPDQDPSAMSHESLSGSPPGLPQDVLPPGLPKDPEIINVTFQKVGGSMGLSIVAAKGEGQKDRGIYVKSVVTGGAAALNGQLQAGDQLLEVDGKSLVGLTQEKAAELMTKTGHTVTLRVAKQGAIYHGLATLLSQPSPVMQRASPAKRVTPQGGGKPRPVSEGRFDMNGPKDGSPMRQVAPDQRDGGPPAHMEPRPLHQQGQYRSSPALAKRTRSLSVPDYFELTSARRSGTVSVNMKDIVREAELRDMQARRDNEVLQGHLNDSIKKNKAKTLPRPLRKLSEKSDRNNNSQRPVRRHSIHSGSISPKLLDIIQQAERRDEKARIYSDVVEGRFHTRSLFSKSLTSLYTEDNQQQSRDNLHNASTGNIRDAPYRQPMLNSQSQQQLRMQDPPHDPSMRSQSVSNLKNEPPRDDRMRGMSTSTLPRAQQSRGEMARHAASQPDLNTRDNRDYVNDVRDRNNYENFQQPYADHMRNERHERPQYQEIQKYQQPQHPRDYGNRPGPQEMNYPPMREQQANQQNQMRNDRPRSDIYAQDRLDVNQNRPRSDFIDPNKVPNWQRDHGPPSSSYSQQDIPRSPAHNQQMQPHFYQNTQPRERSLTPPYDQMRRPAEMQQQMRRETPAVAPKPSVAPKPRDRVAPQEVPRMQVDNRKTQPNFFDPRQAPREPAYGHGGPSYPSPPQPQQQQPQPPGMRPQQSHSATETVTLQPDRYLPPHVQQELMRRRNESPELPPPPPEIAADLPPPPEELRYHDDLPPPPMPDPYEHHHPRGPQPGPASPPGGHDDRYRREPDMRRGPPHDMPRQQGEPPRGPGGYPPQSHPSPQQYGRYPPDGRQKSPGEPRPFHPQGHPQHRPHESQQPQPQDMRRPRAGSEREEGRQWQKDIEYVENASQKRWQNQKLYQQQVQPQQAPSQQRPPHPQQQQHPSYSQSRLMGVKNEPVQDAPSSPSPWEKDEKEKVRKRQQQEVGRYRDQLIEELQSKPSLSPEEQERLRRLRLEQEFQRRVEEMEGKDDDDEDTDMTDKARGRQAMLRMMQENLNTSKQRMQDKDQEIMRQQQQAEAERQERQDRMLQRFEQERNEQKERAARQQEKREREHEEYLQKQKAEEVARERERLQAEQELRERQRREAAEHRRMLLEEEERLKRKREEEVRQKREQERRQMQELQEARDAEERRIREENRRRDEEMEHQRRMMQQLQREQQMQDEYRQTDPYGNYPYEAGYSNYPPPGEQDKSATLPPPNHMPSGSVPPPPERKSSYEYLNQYQRVQPNLNSSAMRGGSDTAGPTKKTVSFDTKPATEMTYNNVDHDQSPASPPGNFPPNGGFETPNGPSTANGDGPETPNYANLPSQTFTTGSTPGVIGAQEVYRDPRARIEATRAASLNKKSGPERMSFRDKMKMFAAEAGELTPQERTKSSRAQKEIERTMVSPQH
ncbi:afadin isoform X2 [Lingula anatina]|uniref:Afadin isoform X2 n=1 Tax=Lingula anatina TaxID=7574 RepID=A0A1S3JJQ5_LINAN|nr:afadin isoform X2 [Lingula anatina]|eukprot:XP_013410608.1 afadin isoform X2 [Lingula anatina]